ncbi:hypothetical protein ABIB25_004664 [Nakamurella sp. UYEF19]
MNIAGQLTFGCSADEMPAGPAARTEGSPDE